MRIARNIAVMVRRTGASMVRRFGARSTRCQPAPASQAGRLDWLVLVPTPPASQRPALLIGDARPADRAALANHFGRAFEETTAPTIVDVIVSIDATPDRFRAACSALSPTGVAVFFGRLGAQELDLRSTVDVDSRRIQVLSRHWVLPRSVMPRRFVPLMCPEAISWYVANLFVPSGRLAQSTVRILSTWPGLARIVAQDQVIIVAGSQRSATPSDLGAALAGTLDVDWDARNAIVLTSGHDQASRTVVLPFETAEREPVCAIKIAGTPDTNPRTRTEHRVLGEIVQDLPPQLIGSVPTPLAELDWHGRAVSVQSALRGRSVAVALGSATQLDQRMEILRSVASWTTELARVQPESVVWGPESHRRWIESLIRRAREVLVEPGALTSFFSRFADASEAAFGSDVTVVRRHFDLMPWNMVWGPDGLGVLDWEMGRGREREARGLPLCDLDYFAKYWLHVAGHATGLDDEKRLFVWFDEDDDVVAERRGAREIIDAARAELGVDARLAPVLVAHGWVKHAVSAAERAADIGARPTTLAPSESYLQVMAERFSFGSLATD